ncbi:hypothetical protein [Haladaptatus halobius]|nr:hypothetical protein [Haladaptatus halobius]
MDGNHWFDIASGVTQYLGIGSSVLCLLPAKELRTCCAFTAIVNDTEKDH